MLRVIAAFFIILPTAALAQGLPFGIDEDSQSPFGLGSRPHSFPDNLVIFIAAVFVIIGGIAFVGRIINPQAQTPLHPVFKFGAFLSILFLTAVAGGLDMGSLSIWHWIIILGLGFGLFSLYRKSGSQTSAYQPPVTQQISSSPSFDASASQPWGPLQEIAQPQTSEPTPQAFSDSGPIAGLALRLKRSQRANALGTILFALDARVDVSAENRALIVKHNLGNRVIYESETRKAYTDAAKARADNSRPKTSIFDSAERQFLGVGKTFLNLGIAAVHATVAALSLRITVDSLMKGVHVECKDMNELLEAEDAIKEAGQNLKAHLEAVTTFDGREETFEL